MNEEALFAAALDKATDAERQAFLDEACGADAGLRRRLERLLAADGQTSGILEGYSDSVLTAAPPEPPLAADRLFAGRFRLRRKLGEGSMGEVWDADQTEPVRRRIALKVVRPGFDSARLLARFEQERQALALMDHPNIARVLDGGVRDGRPWFVMELIEGVPLTEYCDAARLSPRERLELFIPVCQAVQHAHQKGLIHRDIKPSNILVTRYDGKPVPKVIDFGVAKATGPRLTEQSVYTEVGVLIGTLEYMSPEQAELNNLDIDTRSDVYSLGVVLYELLTGSVPFTRRELRAATFTDMLRTIKEVDPPKPSTKLSASPALPDVAAARRTEPKRLRALIRGELDWIVMKCLEKDRSRRYDTADGLAQDLKRRLAEEPVLAGPPSAGYRLRKFLRRNRGPVLAATLFLLALGGGIVGTTIGLVQARQARRAEARRAEGERRAKETAEKRLAQIEKGIDILGSIFENLDPRAEEREGRPLRQILGDRLDRAAAELAGEAVGDPLVVARLQDRLGRTSLGLGRAAEAEALFSRALATRKAHLGAGHPDTLASRQNQALAYQAAGNQALAHQAYQAAGDLHRAIERFEQVRAARVRTLGADHPDTLTTSHHLGVTYRVAGRPAEAVALLEQVGDARAKELGADHPDTLTTSHHLAVAYRADGKLPKAIALFVRVREARVKRLGPDHPDTLTTSHHLALAYREAEKLPEAIALFEQMRDAQVKQLGPDHPRTLATLNNLAWTWTRGKKLPEAIALFEQVRDARMRKLEADNHDALITLSDLADAYDLAGNQERALRLYHQAVLAVEKRKFVHPRAGWIINALCGLHEQRKQFKEAEVWRRKWVATVKARAGAESTAYAEGLSALGSNLLEQGKNAAAEPILRELMVIRRKKAPEEWTTFDAELMLGTALLLQRRHAEAEPFLVRGYQGMKQREAEIPASVAPLILRHALVRLVQLYDALDKQHEAAKWRQELKAILKR
jgi:tetratricopeptide (TPR) repeat protein/tRNA A-37 threonylcarbamoyl transferase component Bud32